MTTTRPQRPEITDQIVAGSVVFDPDFAPTIPPDMTIAEYRRARMRRDVRSRRFWSRHDRETVR
jgi:hypothetical protein